MAYAGMLIELRIASFSCVAFWKMEAEAATSLPRNTGGPRGGNSGCCSVGVTALEAAFELLPERRPDDELDPELRDLFRWATVLVRFTTRVDGAALFLAIVGVALVKVRVKY
jgi:hypothetical protein